MSCRGSTSRSVRSRFRSSAATAWARRRCATPSWGCTRAGLALVPQGRRLFGSLTVDEHLKIVGSKSNGQWNASRVYELFPRLAERRKNDATQLSGGEQQMLA